MLLNHPTRDWWCASNAAQAMSQCSHKVAALAARRTWDRYKRSRPSATLWAQLVRAEIDRIEHAQR